MNQDTVFQAGAANIASDGAHTYINETLKYSDGESCGR